MLGDTGGQQQGRSPSSSYCFSFLVSSEEEEEGSLLRSGSALQKCTAADFAVDLMWNGRCWACPSAATALLMLRAPQGLPLVSPTCAELSPWFVHLQQGAPQRAPPALCRVTENPTNSFPGHAFAMAKLQPKSM